MGYREDMAALIAEREQRNYLRSLMEQAQAPQYAAIEEGQMPTGQMPGQPAPDFGNVQGGASSNYFTRMAEQPQQLQSYESESPPPVMPLRTDPARDTPTRYKDPFYNPQTDRASPPPMNSMRNSETGETISMNFGGGGGGFDLASMNPAWGGQPRTMKVYGVGNDGIKSDIGAEEITGPIALDRSRSPIDIPGVGKAVYGKDGNAYVLGPDGQPVAKALLGYDRAASMAAGKFDQQRRKGEADIAQTEEQIAASRGTRLLKEDPTSQAFLVKRFGTPEKDMRWRADGTLEPIPGGQKLGDAKDVLGILDMAEPLLEKSTGSYAGAGVDELGRFMGMSTPGAQAAAQLKALQGALVAKMPKMSGPQSDKDVLLYKEMAGQIGDPTLPIAQRKAAMGTIRQLNEQYAGGGAVGGGNAALIQEAQAAIARGAPREAVLQRLRQRGVTASL